MANLVLSFLLIPLPDHMVHILLYTQGFWNKVAQALEAAVISSHPSLFHASAIKGKRI